MLAQKTAPSRSSRFASSQSMPTATRGARAAVASSSRNCAAILRAARLSSLFDVRVDGVDLDRLGLPGKPAPDMFLEAARRLGVAPAHVVVFEDATAGVKAAKAGGFSLVIGVGAAERAGALRARQVAVAMVETGFVREARVTFAWGPRDQRPTGVVLEADGRVLDAVAAARWLQRFDPSLAATHEELGLAKVNWENCARAGHFGRGLAWDRGAAAVCTLFEMAESAA